MRPQFSPLVGRFFSGKQKDFLFFLVGYGVGCYILGGPGILGLALSRCFIPGQLSIEFINVGGWLDFW